MIAPSDLGLYIHWPFCESKCAYCDFNSHVRDNIDQVRWRNALSADMAHEAARTPGRRLASIFFGGGTPSLMSPETVAALVSEARRLWPCAADLEITLEANPSSVEAERFAAFAAAGVNRLSLGVQSLDETVLRFLTRRHDAAQARRALELAQRHFPRASMDLIYARPGQSAAMWADELAAALDFGFSHMSLYQLTIEPNTGFAGAYRRGAFCLPDEEAAAALFEVTQARMEAAGLPLYEISNHAAPGQACQHNLIYWRYCDYVGIGPGAHGRRTAAATTRWRRPEAWLAQVEASGHGLETETALTPRERAEEALLMGLRLREGIDAAWFLARTDMQLDDVVDARRVQQLQEDGLIETDSHSLRATSRGLLLLNAVIGAIASA